MLLIWSYVWNGSLFFPTSVDIPDHGPEYGAFASKTYFRHLGMIPFLLNHFPHRNGNKVSKLPESCSQLPTFNSYLLNTMKWTSKVSNDEGCWRRVQPGLKITWKAVKRFAELCFPQSYRPGGSAVIPQTAGIAPLPLTGFDVEQAWKTLLGCSRQPLPAPRFTSLRSLPHFPPNFPDVSTAERGHGRGATIKVQ